jgi:hypothetical protein
MMPVSTLQSQPWSIRFTRSSVTAAYYVTIETMNPNNLDVIFYAEACLKILQVSFSGIFITG